MPELLDLHGRAMTEFDRRVRGMRATQWADPTPCASWDVHDLVAHLVREQLWVPHLLAGSPVAEVGDRFEGDVLGEEPVAVWEVAAREARAAWLQPGAQQRTVHLSAGDAPGSVYLWEMTFDLAVHAWDLARAIGADERIDPELTEALLEWVGEEGMAGADGLFAPPVHVGENAAPLTRLLALAGRRG
ncbi:uncharacterized protein (TIGR03086 family) [Nocardiopsis mwathae]|uniref:Uncharacterized protein (TIGR03086 family) n=1 Tax=Nocardiopsis mwathae TaxID=1472723 RepID=A0A7W9YGK0_9ACTN|nr:TIGR03086 family metal-binding protein [Nocardiopsis mwathae]MBB6171727.1 uncharacterized protein (TIGR03086 family) [Nocardiopsis mwathae]